MKVGRRIGQSSIAFVLLIAILLSVFIPVTWVSATGTEKHTDNEKADETSVVSLEDKDPEKILLGDSYSEEVKIGDEQGLRDFANRVNGGDTMKEVRVELTADITLDSGVVWVPIGSDVLKPFSGLFDGKGHKISGLRVEAEIEGGLFGYVKEAIIKNLTLENYVAPKSTYGFFFSATDSTVEFSQSKTDAQAQLSAFAMSPRYAAPVGWTTPGTYNRDISWYGDGKAKTVFISTPDQLAGLTEFTNFSSFLIPPAGAIQDSLYGWTFILANDLDLENADWVPIGAYGDHFSGRFVGNGKEIKNLKIDEFDPYGLSTPSGAVGLFGSIENAVITDFTIDGVEISGIADATWDIGSVVGYSQDSNINKIILRNVSIDVNDGGSGNTFNVGGVCGYVGEGTISDCLVIGEKGNPNTKISTKDVSGGCTTGGIAGTIAAKSAQRLVVYGMTIQGNGVGGISGRAGNMDQTVDNLQQILVMGCTLNATTDYAAMAGITGSSLGFYVHDSIVSDLAMSTDPFTPSRDHNAVGVDIYADAGSQHNDYAQYVFTDSSLKEGFIMDSSTFSAVSSEKASNNYWDNLSAHNYIYTGQTTPVENEFGNKGLATQRLIDGTWVPNARFWRATKGYYPQLTVLQEHIYPEIQKISDIAAIPLASEEPEQNYVIGSQKLTVPTHSPNGDKITWVGLAGVAGLDVKTEDDVTVMTTKKGFITVPKITAKVNGFEKSFENLTVIDGFLELIAKPVSGQTIAKDTIFRLEFGEDITENPERLEEITLNALIDGQTVPRKQIFAEDDGTPTSPFKIVADGSGVKRYLDIGPLNLDNGVNYELVLPKGIVREEVVYNGKSFYNVSDEASFTFNTASVSSPIIQISEPVVYYPVSQGPVVSEMLSKVTVWSQENAVLMVDKGQAVAPAVFAELDSSLWDKGNPSKSISAAVNNTTQFPPNTRTVRYIIDEASILGANRKAGTYRLYIIAVNEENRVSTNVLTIKLEGTPDWLVEPQEAVHIPWTDNLDAVLSAAKQGAMAIVKETNAAGEEKDVVSPVSLSYDKTQWGNIEQIGEGPSKIVVKVEALSASGLLSREKDVTVYLDKHLNMVMTPSPVTMSYSTKKQVEKKINPIALNFNNSIFEYDHWTNNYRKAGLYYVDVTSKPQSVTYCSNPKCVYPGDHPADRIDETFIINMIYPPAEEYINKWGDAARIMLEGDGYSKDITEISPHSYLLPEAILKTLDEMDYGRVQFNFGDDYRWKLYSSTLSKAYVWNEFYSLKLNPVEDKAVTKLIGGKGMGVQFEFTQQGRLFGKAEVELKLDSDEENIKELMKKNLGLYMYNKDRNELHLVSDVFIVEGQWASGAIDFIAPTTYVIKEKEAGDVLFGYDDSFMPFRMTVNRDAQGNVIDQSPKLVKSYEELIKITNMPVNYETSMFYSRMIMEEKSDKRATAAVAVTSILALAVVGGGILVYRRKTRRGEQNNEK